MKDRLNNILLDERTKLNGYLDNLSAIKRLQSRLADALPWDEESYLCVSFYTPSVTFSYRNKDRDWIDENVLYALRQKFNCTFDLKMYPDSNEIDFVTEVEEVQLRVSLGSPTDCKRVVTEETITQTRYTSKFICSGEEAS